MKLIPRPDKINSRVYVVNKRDFFSQPHTADRTRQLLKSYEAAGWRFLCEGQDYMYFEKA